MAAADVGVVFHYAPSREHRHVEAFLWDYSGTLLSDGYQCYDAFVKGVIYLSDQACQGNNPQNSGI